MKLAGGEVGDFVENIGTTSHPAPSFSSGPHSNHLKTEQIQDPSWFVVCGDSLWNDIEYPSAVAFPEICGSFSSCGGECCEVGCEESNFWTDTESGKKYARHMGGSNIGFADGHGAGQRGTGPERASRAMPGASV